MSDVMEMWHPQLRVSLACHFALIILELFQVPFATRVAILICLCV